MPTNKFKGFKNDVKDAFERKDHDLSWLEAPGLSHVNSDQGMEKLKAHIEALQKHRLMQANRDSVLNQNF